MQQGIATHIPLVLFFPDINRAKDALLLHTVAKGLSYRVKVQDHRRYVVECTSPESCAFRLRFTPQKQGTVKTTISTPHTCPQDNHFEWNLKAAKGVKYLRLKYQDNTDIDPRKIRAAEKSRGNTVYGIMACFMSSCRHHRCRRREAPVEETVEEEGAPVEEEGALAEEEGALAEEGDNFYIRAVINRKYIVKNLVGAV